MKVRLMARRRMALFFEVYYDSVISAYVRLLGKVDGWSDYLDKTEDYEFNQKGGEA